MPLFVPCSERVSEREREKELISGTKNFGLRVFQGDFGWAVTRDDDLSLRSPEGAGSLWYAPPELNPPVEGVFNKPGQQGRLNWKVPAIYEEGSDGGNNLVLPCNSKWFRGLIASWKAFQQTWPGAVIGKSDMWSAGVVIYVILVPQISPIESSHWLWRSQPGIVKPPESMQAG